MSTKKKAPSLRREDRPGHLDPAYAASLVAKGQETHSHDEERAFVRGAKSKDGLAEELGEEAVRAMTSGENDLASDRDAQVDEDLGGPFVESTGRDEFAKGTDASNPKGAEREPFPRT